MGNNIESGGGKGTLKSPLYSNGTSEMETDKVVGNVEGPKGSGSITADTSNATVISPKE